jgi:hypothetical protein
MLLLGPKGALVVVLLVWQVRLGYAAGHLKSGKKAFNVAAGASALKKLRQWQQQIVKNKQVVV